MLRVGADWGMNSPLVRATEGWKSNILQASGMWADYPETDTIIADNCRMVRERFDKLTKRDELRRLVGDERKR